MSDIYGREGSKGEMYLWVAALVRSITGAEIRSYLHSPLSTNSCRMKVSLKGRCNCLQQNMQILVILIILQQKGRGENKSDLLWYVLGIDLIQSPSPKVTAMCANSVSIIIIHVMASNR